MAKIGVAKNRVLGWGVVVLAAAMAGDAEAVQQPAHLHGRADFEVASGAPVRTHRDLSLQVPRQRAQAWQRLEAEAGQAFAYWDPQTGVPSRIALSAKAPSTVASAAAAERVARDWLAQHLDLLAPGSNEGDFQLVSNHLDAGIRSVGFVQHHRGMRVLRGQVSFRFKDDRLFLIGSEALPEVDAEAGPALSVDLARLRARQWVESDMASHATATSVAGPFVLPLLRAGATEYRTVFRVVVDAAEPLGRWDVYLDGNGDRVARQQTLAFAASNVLYNVPERRPGATRLDLPAMFADLGIAGDQVVSDASGTVDMTNAGSVTMYASGTYANVHNQAGGEASKTLPLSPGGDAIWNASDSQYTDAQLATFIHTTHVSQLSKSFAGDLAYLDTQIQAYVNINNSCNAFYDGDSINFFVAQGGCGNTGRLADIIRHEFGHAIHDHSIIEGVGDWDSALSEGVGDFIAVTISGDSGMGRGFWNSNEPLREVDPSDWEHMWPEDVGEIHWTGLIIAGALWDMRKAMVEALGEEAGVAAANHVYYQAMRRAVDIPTMYLEALAADDDDGDLTNGTPNVCAINAGFAAHGLRKVSAQASTLSVAPPHLDGYEVALKMIGMYGDCPSDKVGEATVEWSVRGDSDVGGQLAMDFTSSGFVAELPPQQDGTVLQYRIRLQLASGDETVYPDNAADPFYELFIGHVEPLYCTDFESDPEADGWSHGLESGSQQDGADDWQWGETLSPPSSGDPQAAFSGERAFGNDMGGGEFNGIYQSNKVNFALSPVVDTNGYQTVRLQYRRWLNVEDAYFDRATIYADGEVVWRNLDSQQGDDSDTHHRDREWRFHDVDVSAAAQDGEVQLRFELDTDNGFELGGWTMDDVCVVGFVETICGDGEITGMEQCDDGDDNSSALADHCRDDCVSPSCGDGVVDSGELCDDGNLIDDDGCDAECQSAEWQPPNDTPGGGLDPERAPWAPSGCLCRASGPADGSRFGFLLLAALGLGVLRRNRGPLARK